MPFLLHRIWQEHHIPPDEIYSKPFGVQAFIYASELIVIDYEIEKSEEYERQKNAGM